ncbi:MAG: hypothetical protein J7L38_07835 [Thermoproteales archaeon]|nr:hypothetical protein [Thermoproteales archaeon]
MVSIVSGTREVGSKDSMVLLRRLLFIFIRAEDKRIINALDRLVRVLSDSCIKV